VACWGMGQMKTLRAISVACLVLANAVAAPAWGRVVAVWIIGALALSSPNLNVGSVPGPGACS
jgi:hypothetical protein